MIAGAKARASVALDKMKDENGKIAMTARAPVQVFVDSATMKRQLEEKIKKKRYDVTDLYWTEGRFQAIARHSLFESITLGVIAFNAIWISIDSDLNDAALLSEAAPQFIVMENLFCLYFSAELLIRFLSFRVKKTALGDPWFVFDSFMVLMMVTETWLLVIIFACIGSSNGSGGLGNASILRILRLLRLSRMMRMVRLLRSMPELMILIKGIAAAIRSVAFTIFLLLVMIYIYAIIFVQLTRGSLLGDTYFPSVPDGMHTLLLDGVLVDSLGGLIDTIIDNSSFLEAMLYLFLLYMFVLLAAVTMMNMLIGVVCEVVSAVSECEHEEMTLLFMKSGLEELIPPEDQTEITKEKFLDILHNDHRAADLLEEVEVKMESILDLIDTIFTSEDGKAKVLEFPDLVKVMLNFRSTKVATFADITGLRKSMSARVDRSEAEKSNTLWQLEATIKSLSEVIETAAKVEKGTIERMAKEAVQAEREALARALSQEADLQPKGAPTSRTSKQDLSPSPSLLGVPA